jgi:large subunit ribosomal protein L4
MVQQALRCTLSDQARSGGVRLVDEMTFDVPKTKVALGALAALDCAGKVLVVLGRHEEVATKSFANLPAVVTIPADQLTAYDVLNADVILFTDATLPGEAVEAAAAPKKRAAKATGSTKAAAAKAKSEPAEAVDEAPAPKPVADSALAEEAAVVEEEAVRAVAGTEAAGTEAAGTEAAGTEQTDTDNEGDAS